MNSNEIFSRLEGLMKKLSMSSERGSYTRAEMKAYAAGIALAAENMERVLKNLFIDTAENDGIALFLSMINENPAQTESESKQLIIDTVSNQMQIYKKSEFDSLVASLGVFGESTYITDDNIITLYYTGLVDMPCFKKRAGRINCSYRRTVTIIKAYKVRRIPFFSVRLRNMYIIITAMIIYCRINRFIIIIKIRSCRNICCHPLVK